MQINPDWKRIISIQAMALALALMLFVIAAALAFVTAAKIVHFPMQ